MVMVEVRVWASNGGEGGSGDGGGCWLNLYWLRWIRIMVEVGGGC